MYFRLDNCPLTGRYFKPCACMHTAHHICLILCVFLLDTSIYLKAYGQVFWLQLFTSMAWNWWVLKIANLQSCAKSVNNLHSLTHRMPVPWIWWSTLFIGGQKWSSHTLTLFFWGRGEVFVVTCDFFPPPPSPHICLVICVPLPRKHISLLNLLGRGTLSLGIWVPYSGNRKP